MKRLLKFVKDEEGLVAIEYALIATLVALAFVVGAGALGTKLEAVFQTIVTKLGP